MSRHSPNDFTSTLLAKQLDHVFQCLHSRKRTLGDRYVRRILSQCGYLGEDGQPNEWANAAFDYWKIRYEEQRLHEKFGIDALEEERVFQELVAKAARERENHAP